MVYLAAQQQNKLTQFPVCANVGVLFTLDIRSVTGLREAHPNSTSNFGFGENYTANNVMSCFGA